MFWCCCHDEEIIACNRGCWSCGRASAVVVMTAEREREVGASFWFLMARFFFFLGGGYGFLSGRECENFLVFYFIFLFFFSSLPPFFHYVR
jgi:hypothetical protein